MLGLPWLSKTFQWFNFVIQSQNIINIFKAKQVFCQLKIQFFFPEILFLVLMQERWQWNQAGRMIWPLSVIEVHDKLTHLLLLYSKKGNQQIFWTVQST